MTRETMSALALFVAWCDFSMFAMAQMFGAEVAYGGSPIRPETYGEAVYEIPALVWVAIQMNAALLAMAGAVIFAASVRFARAGAFMMGLGNSILAALFAMFGVLAAGATDGALVRYMSLGPGVMVASACAILGGRFFFWGDRA